MEIKDRFETNIAVCYSLSELWLKEKIKEIIQMMKKGLGESDNKEFNEQLFLLINYLEISLKSAKKKRMRRITISIVFSILFMAGLLISANNLFKILDYKDSLLDIVSIYYNNLNEHNADPKYVAAYIIDLQSKKPY